MNNNLTWAVVDSVAAELGANPEARRKWRQRQVPPSWRIKISAELMRRGVPMSISEFESL